MVLKMSVRDIWNSMPAKSEGRCVSELLSVFDYLSKINFNTFNKGIKLVERQTIVEQFEEQVVLTGFTFGTENLSQPAI